MTAALAEHIARATETFASAGVASAESDSWQIASHVMGTPRGELHAQMIMRPLEMTSEQQTLFTELVTRRASREPLWHIIGMAPFLDMDLSVGPGVFTPRPETELVATAALEEARSLHPGEGGLKVVDLCAGSGALALAMARGLVHAEVLALELSDLAEPFLRQNIATYAPSVELLMGDIEILRDHKWAGSIDLIVTNPPYLRPDEPLDRETKDYDPQLALVSGEDGLELIRRLIGLAVDVMRPGGVLVMEHGVDQGDSIREILAKAGFLHATTVADLVGRERFTRAVLRGS